MVNSCKLVAFLSMQPHFLFKICVPMENLGGGIFGDILLKEFTQLVSQIGCPFFVADISENRVLHWVLNVRQSVVLQKFRGLAKM
jgi:hypothetical protein